MKKPAKKKIEKTAAAKNEDVAVVCGATPDGNTLGILRQKGQQVEASVVQRMEAGKPLHGEVIQLKPREDSVLCDVEVLHEGPTRKSPKPKSSGRPAQVASDEYRRGWDRLFKPPRKNSKNRTLH